MEDRVVDIDLRGSFDMKIVRGLTSAETEHVLCEVTATDASRLPHGKTWQGRLGSCSSGTHAQ